MITLSELKNLESRTAALATINVFVVACVSKKLETPAPAKDLYQSNWFKAARSYVESTGKPWCILSAMHGLVHPEVVLEPYDRQIGFWGGKREREGWGGRAIRMLPHILTGLPSGNDLVIGVIAGEDYVDAIWCAARFSRWRIVRPLQGLGIGQQVAWMQAEARRAGGAA